MTTSVGLWPRVRTVMSAISPFTYNDNVTYQKLLYLAIDKIDEVITWSAVAVELIAEMGREIDEFKADTEKALAQQKEELREEQRQMENRLTDLIEKIAVGGIAFNPTNGTRHEDVSKVISDVYDFVRVHARSVGEIDATLTTVDDWEALTIGAKQFDLDPTEETPFATP